MNLVKVIFRFWRGEVIALFPQIPADGGGYYVQSYMHLGQHSAADYGHIVSESRLATESEYNPLRRELESIGYDLAIAKRSSYADYRLRKIESRA